jgi:hypothetical protein
MFLYQFEIPQRLTTDFFAVHGRDNAYYAERMVAIRKPKDQADEEDKYCLRKGAKSKDPLTIKFLLAHPFSSLHGLRDRFNDYSDYKLSLSEAYEALKTYETDHARFLRPFGRPRDATHISGYPLVLLQR